jgi:serpin B
LPQERLHPTYNSLDRALLGADSADFDLNIANAVWAQEKLPVKSDYLDALAENYSAGIQLADFKNAPGEAVERINAWVNQETAGRIPQLVDEIEPGVALMLVNAIYFNAKWDKTFKEASTSAAPFYLLDGAEVEAPLMHQTEDFRYTEGDGYQAVQLPYQGLTTAMEIVLPAEGRFREIESGLTGEWIDDVTKGFALESVVLTMPKFTYGPKLSLDRTLSDMGMPDAFDPVAADLSGSLIARTTTRGSARSCTRPSLT